MLEGEKILGQTGLIEIFEGVVFSIDKLIVLTLLNSIGFDSLCSIHNSDMALSSLDIRFFSLSLLEKKTGQTYSNNKILLCFLSEILKLGQNPKLCIFIA